MHLTNLKILETKGFVVIPSFLSYDEVGELVEIFSFLKQEPFFLNRNKGYQLLNSEPSAALKNKVLELLKSICQQTNIKVDIPLNLTYFDTSLVQFPWHQDHDCFYQWQDLYNFVNCWIPILKPHLEEGNLELIPHDVLQTLIPEFFNNSIKGQGQYTFYSSKEKTLIQHHGTHQITLFDFDLETIKEIPYVNAGDLVLYRGDVIHKTQNGDRVAVNLRSVYSETIVYKDKFLQGGIYKQKFIDNNAGYDIFKSKFNLVTEFPLSALYKS